MGKTNAVVIVVGLSGAWLGTAAHAHVALLDPPSRWGPDVLKEGPCGDAGGARGETVAVFEPGQTITLTFDEYINHPGHFRVAFDDDGDDDFADPVCTSHCTTKTDPTWPTFETGVDPTVLADMITDTQGGETRFEVRLPDVECERCVLQVIQVMYDKRPYTSPGNDNYYQCADIALRRPIPADDEAVEPSPEPSPETSAETIDDADASATAEPTTPADTSTERSSSYGGCGASGAVDASSSLLTMVLAAAWMAVARRSRQRSFLMRRTDTK